MLEWELHQTFLFKDCQVVEVVEEVNLSKNTRRRYLKRSLSTSLLVLHPILGLFQVKVSLKDTAMEVFTLLVVQPVMSL